jgi:hypothetical protein
LKINRSFGAAYHIYLQRRKICEAINQDKTGSKLFITNNVKEIQLLVCGKQVSVILPGSVPLLVFVLYVI